MRRAFSGLVLLLCLSIVATFAVPTEAHVGDTPSMFSVNLDVPFHGQETGYFCGAATAQMWIEYSTGVLVDQNTLFWDYEHGIWFSNWEPWYWYTSPHGLAATVSYYLEDSPYATIAPPATISEYAYTDPSVAVVYQARSILTYGQPTAALTLHGNHWMVVKGVVIDDQHDLIKGFFVHDPWAYVPAYGSLGQDSFKTLVAWTRVTFTPNVFGELWYQDYVTVEYNPDGIHAVAVAPEFPYAPALPPMSARFVSMSDVVAAAKGGFADNALYGSDAFASIAGAQAQDPIRVQSLSRDIPSYFIVPFTLKGRIVAAALVDASTGVFLEASVGTMPTSAYLPLTVNQVAKAMESLAGERLASSPILSWMPLDTPGDMYHPFWVGTTVSGSQVAVDLEGSVIAL